MRDYTPTPDYYNDYICHHGIKGQKWGVMHGPPYPLGSDKSTGSKLKNSGSVKKKKTSSISSVQKVKNQKRTNIKTESSWNKSSSYNKEFLDYVKDDIGSPEMVDDPELMDLLVQEYEEYTGKKARNLQKSANIKKTTIDRNSAEYKDKLDRLASRDTNAQKEDTELYKKYEENVSKLAKYKPADNEWYGEDRRLTKKAKDYLEKTDKLYDEYSEKSLDLWHKSQDEIKELRKDLFLTDDIKEKTNKLYDIYKEMDTLRDKTIGEDSEYAKKAFKKYNDDLKKRGETYDDDGYGFYHYTWRSGNADYDKANAEYKAKTKELDNKYNALAKEIVKDVAGENLDKKVKSTNKYINGNTYNNTIGSELISFIQHDYEYILKKKG